MNYMCMFQHYLQIFAIALDSTKPLGKEIVESQARQWIEFPVTQFRRLCWMALLPTCASRVSLASAAIQWWGETTSSYKWSSRVWEITGSKFKTSGNLLIIVEESMESAKMLYFESTKKSWKITTCDWLDLGTLGFKRLCPKISLDIVAIQYKCSWFMNDVRTQWCRSQATTQLQVSWWGDSSSFHKINQLTMRRESTYLLPISNGSGGIGLLSTCSLQSESILLHMLQPNTSIF